MMTDMEHKRLILALKTVSAALRLVKHEAELGLSRTASQLIDTALQVAEEELEDEKSDA